jgi:hypothetical protein
VYICQFISETPFTGSGGLVSGVWHIQVTFLSLPGYVAGNTHFPGIGETDLYKCCGAPGTPITFDFSGPWTPIWTGGTHVPVYVVPPTSPLSVQEAFGFGSQGGINATVGLTAVPEPATLALVGGGLLVLGAAARRRRA